MATADEQSLPVTTTANSKEVLKCPVLNVSSLDKSIDRRGCCSHHGGVCGCSGTSQQCCDGTLSPSCTCNKEDGDKVVN